MAFVPPSRLECERAIGRRDDEPPPLRRALEFDDSFQPVPAPGPNDWLSFHAERGQTFQAFQTGARGAPPVDWPICIQRLDDPRVTAGPWLDYVVDFTRAFFAREVVVLPPLSLPPRHLRSRLDRETRQVQYFAGDILLELAAGCPQNALCVLGLTACDIYPDVFVQYAFGVASSVHRVALCSLARFGPPYFEDSSLEPAGVALRRRVARVIGHEVCHVLGMQHCIYANCLMNGSAGIADSDRRPLHLCPVDLHKLQWLLGFNVVERFRSLLAFWVSGTDRDEARWVSGRLRHVLDERIGLPPLSLGTIR